MVLVRGEAGIGKTSLVERFALDKPATWGRCREEETAAFTPWAEALAEWAGENAKGRTLAMLVQGLPEFRWMASVEATGGAGLSVADVSASLMDGAAAWIRERLAGRPRVLILEDVHAADLPSLHLLAHLETVLRNQPLLLLATRRLRDPLLQPTRAGLIDRVERNAVVLDLARLGREDVSRLLARRLQQLPKAEVVERTMALTEGTPLFVRKAAELLARGESLWGGDTWGHTGPAPDLTLSLEVSWRRLAPHARAVAQHASVWGSAFRLDDLRAMLREEPLATFAEGVNEALTSGLFRRSAADEHTLQFEHALMREVVYRSLHSEQKARLHALAASTLIARGAAASAAAAHLLRAETAVDPEMAAGQCQAAAQEAESNFAHQDVAFWYEQARTFLGSVRLGPNHVTVLLKLANCYFRLGRAGDAVALAEMARAWSKQLGRQDLFAAATLLLGSELVVGRVSAELIAALEEALEALHPGPSALRCRLLARLAAACQPGGTQEATIQRAREAVRMCRSLGDDSALPEVLRWARSTYLRLDSLSERISLDVETLEHAHRRGDHGAALDSHYRLARERMEEGRPDAAARELDAYDRLCRELRQERLLWRSLQVRGEIAVLAGRFALAEERFSEAEAVAGGEVNRNAMLQIEAGRVAIALFARRGADLPGAFAKFLRFAPAALRMGLEAWATGSIALAQRDRPAAREALERLRASSWAMKGRFQSLITEMFAYAGEAEWVAERYDQLVPWAEFCDEMAGSFHQQLGQLAAALGRAQEARAHFERALDANVRFGAQPALMMTQLDLAELLDHESPGERARAAQLRARAAASAKALDMDPSLWRDAPEVDPFRLVTSELAITDQEHRILSLVERGLTNREVASLLDISPNTVRNRLASIFHKLNVSTRAELVFHLAQLRANGSSDRP